MKLTYLLTVIVACVFLSCSNLKNNIYQGSTIKELI